MGNSYANVTAQGVIPTSFPTGSLSSSSLGVTGNAFIAGNFGVTGSVYVMGNLGCTGNTNINGVISRGIDTDGTGSGTFWMCNNKAGTVNIMTTSSHATNVNIGRSDGYITTINLKGNVTITSTGTNTSSFKGPLKFTSALHDVTKTGTHQLGGDEPYFQSTSLDGGPNAYDLALPTISGNHRYIFKNSVQIRLVNGGTIVSGTWVSGLHSKVETFYTAKNVDKWIPINSTFTIWSISPNLWGISGSSPTPLDFSDDNIITVNCSSSTFSIGRPNDNSFWISSNNYVNGVYLAGASSAGWVNISDITMKENITPIASMLDKINELNPCQYNYIGNKDELCMGFIAQEFQNQFPNLIYKSNDKLGIAYTGLIPVIIKALQEQQEQINSLKDIINKLLINKN